MSPHRPLWSSRSATVRGRSRRCRSNRLCSASWFPQYRGRVRSAPRGLVSVLQAQKSPRQDRSLSAGARRRQSQYLVCGFPGCDVIYIPFLSWFGNRHSPVLRMVRWQVGRGIELVDFQSRFQQFRHGRRPSPPEGHHDAPRYQPNVSSR